MADEATGEIDWYLPDPRAILPLDGLHISRSLARTVRQGLFEVRFDDHFEGVMRGCAERLEGSWISEEFIRVYLELHRQGVAHSVESWKEGRLVGGLYGVALGGAFMGESMFYRETDASKAALVGLVDRRMNRGFTLLDVQFLTPHLERLGALEIPHSLYSCLLRSALRIKARLAP